MNAIATPASDASCLHSAGAFRLDEGRALSLQPQAASLLRVKQGRVWATLAGTPGDHVLVPGSTLHIPAGARLVIEPWPLQERCPVFFDWDPAPVYLAAPQARVTMLPVLDPGLAGQRMLMRQALGDLRVALGATAGAAARLALGAARFAAGWLVRPLRGALA